MLYTIESHLDTVPVIASFSRDGQVIPLYVQLDGRIYPGLLPVVTKIHRLLCISVRLHARVRQLSALV